jgi:DNA-binding transcriptional LysR family regulator
MENIISGHHVNVILQLSHLEAVKAAVLRGLGVSMLPYSAIRFELAHGLLAVANNLVFRVPRHLVLIRKRSSVETETIRRFVDFLHNKDWMAKYRS